MFEPGTPIAWRNCLRVAGEYQPSYAAAMRVVHDHDGDLALYRGPGYPMRRRDAELRPVGGFRHQPVVRFIDTWRADPDWGRWRVLVLMDPRGRHALSLFWNATIDALDFWYIDLIRPATRHSHGFDFLEHGLDIVVAPDLSSWRWKDQDELEWQVSAGTYSRSEADALYAEGRTAVDRLLSERERFERWRSWRPPADWDDAVLPAGWDAL